MFEFFGSLSKEICSGGKPLKVMYDGKIIDVCSFDISFNGTSISEMLNKIDINDFDEIRIKRKIRY